MPIERLTLRDFQCHEKLTVDLDPLVTVLVGRTDAGKSAVLRALKWLCHNRPGGSGFVRRGSASCSATLRVDSHTVKRRKAPGENSYRVDGRKLVAFGASVPNEIADILNISDLNLAAQMDPPFWFLKSPGEVSKELNAIVDLGLIDRTMGNLSAGVRKATATTSVCKERLTAAESSLERLSWVPGAVTAMERIDRLETGIAEKADLLGRIDDLLSEGVRIKLEADHLSQAIFEGSAGMERLDSLLERLESVRERREKLESAVQSYMKTVAERDAVAAQVKALKRELRKLGDSCPACGRPF